MAYLNRLVSAPGAEVETLRVDPAALVTPSMAVSVSHLIAYWVQVRPLGQLLGRAIDGGLPLNSLLRHQLRDPCYHDPGGVRSLHKELSEAWQQAVAVGPVPADDWYRVEIEKVLRLFGHAAGRGECVISVLEPCQICFGQTT